MLRQFLISSVLAATTVFGATITIPSTVINGSDAVGPTITLPASLLPTDTLTLTASGQVFLQPGNTFGTNPAGVLTTAGSSPVGAILVNSSTSPAATDFGSLLLGNTLLGFHQLFPANAANGLGSATAPSSLTITSVSLSSLGFSALSSGTVLHFLVSDTGYSDNSGSFTVAGSFNTAGPTTVPEPGTLTMLVGALALGAFRLGKRA